MQERPDSFPESLSGGPPYSEGRKEGRKIFIWQSIHINCWYLQYNNFSLGDHHYDRHA